MTKLKKSKKSRNREEYERDLGEMNQRCVLFEKLPFPYYHNYTFPSYSTNENSEEYICSCCVPFISNYIIMHEVSNKSLLENEGYFSETIRKHLNLNKNLMDCINFKDEICHMCNSIIPLRHNLYIYNSDFENRYGEYIVQLGYKYGIIADDYSGIYFWEQLMPEHMLKIIKPTQHEIMNDVVHYANISDKETLINIENVLNIFFSLDEDDRNYMLYYHYFYRSNYNFFSAPPIMSWEFNEKIYDFEVVILKIINKVMRHRFIQVRKIVVNEVKKSFKISRWVNQSMLFEIIKGLFPKNNVYSNYRPKILEGLELDVFVDGLNLGIEYQGIQHVTAIEHWGGEEGLEIRKKHDNKKLKLCDKNNIKIIYFWHYEKISTDLVVEKLKEYIYP